MPGERTEKNRSLNLPGGKKEAAALAPAIEGGIDHCKN